MIDTVVITLDQSEFTLPSTSYDKFTPSANGIFKPPYYRLGNKKYIKCVLNPSTDDMKQGEYLPRLTLYKAVRSGGFSVFLHIEFSAQKILFNNNFDELVDQDFDEVCSRLAKKMRSMGVFVFSSQLAKASVKTIHYSKNIILTDYTTASAVISDLSKVNLSRKKNLATKSFENEGQALYFYTSKRGLVAYDKARELKKAKCTKKGLKEKDYYCQLSLFDKKIIKRPFEVLRIEGRYLDKRTINTLMKQCEIALPAKTSFKDYFSSAIARKVLLSEFNQIIDSRLGLSSSKSESFVDFALDLRAQNPRITLKALSEAIAFKALSSETGSRDVRDVIGASNNQWYRLTKNLSSLSFQRKSNRWLDTIQSQLEAFKKVRISDYESVQEEVY